MKKVIIVIHKMDIGGAQRSMISFLKCLHDSAAKDDYDIHVLPIDCRGEFLQQIPTGIKLIQPVTELRWMGSSLSRELIVKHFSIPALIAEISWMVKSRIGSPDKSLNRVQQLWKCWKSIIPENTEKYDVAVSYMDGCSSYYVIDKINADKKVLWVHSEYQKQQYSAEFDEPYYKKSNAIITISKLCKECFIKAFPDMKSKISVLENITSADEIIEKSRESGGYYVHPNRLKLLSVGRLHPQKGMDIAVKAAKRLKEYCLEFDWLIVGDGEEREALKKLIGECGLEGHVQLLGKKENPYVYMRECDIIVQPSRVEGKSIVLDEAKILCKPIVSTNYSTVSDSIEHGKTGWIVDMNPHALADGIMTLARDTDMRLKLSGNLRNSVAGNTHELQKYIDIML